MTLNISTYPMSGVDESASFLGGLSTTLNSIDGMSAVLNGAPISVVSSTTLVNITALSLPVVDAGVYIIKGRLVVSNTINNGMKVAFSGTCTADDFNVNVSNKNNATTNYQGTVNALNTAGGAATAVCTDVFIDGTLIVENGGTFVPQFSANASSVDALLVIPGSYIFLKRVA